jgi:uncharacterized protein YggE
MRGEAKRIARIGALAMVAVLCGTQGAEAQERAPVRRSIDVSASGEVQVTPDAAEIIFSVETVGTTAQQAGQENARVMQRVIAAVSASGVPRDSVVTRGYSVNPEYAEARGGEPPRIRGYRASNQVVVKAPRIDQVGALIDVALGAGANRFDGVSFLVRNPEPARQEALRAAVARARSSAEVIASALGVRLGTVLTAATSVNIPRPVAYARMAAMAEAAPTPIQPGEQTVRADVTVSFSIVGS